MFTRLHSFMQRNVEDLNDLDLSYTPPLSSPWDPVQMAAQAWSRTAAESYFSLRKSNGERESIDSVHRQFRAKPNGGRTAKTRLRCRFEVESAGTKPGSVRSEAIAVMRGLGIDISGNRSKHVDEFQDQHFDYLITVCDNAKESCPVFFGAANRLHHNFEVPAALQASDEDRLALFRRVRDELRDYLRKFASNPSQKPT